MVKVTTCFRLLEINLFVLNRPEEPLYINIVNRSSFAIHLSFDRFQTFNEINIFIRSKLGSPVGIYDSRFSIFGYSNFHIL